MLAMPMWERFNWDREIYLVRNHLRLGSCDVREGEIHGSLHATDAAKIRDFPSFRSNSLISVPCTTFKFIFRGMQLRRRFIRGDLFLSPLPFARGFEFSDLFHFPTNPSHATMCGCRTPWLTFSTSPASVLPSLPPRMRRVSRKICLPPPPRVTPYVKRQGGRNKVACQLASFLSLFAFSRR